MSVHRFVCFLILLLTAFQSETIGQVLVTSAPDQEQSHAWAAYQSAEDGVYLVHLPPRGQMVDELETMRSGLAGEIKPVRPLASMPEGIASIDDRVFLVFEPTAVGDRMVRRVYSGRAVPSPIGGVWSFWPYDRLDPEPAIFHAGELVNLIAAHGTLWALIKLDGVSELLKLDRNSWESVALPALGADWRLSSVNGQLLAINQIVQNNEHELQAFELGEESVWSSSWPRVEVDGSVQIVPGIHGVYLIEASEDGPTALRVWSQVGDFVLKADGFNADRGSFAALGSVNRLVHVSRAQLVPSFRGEDVENDSPSLVIREYDLSSGEELYSGSPVVVPPMSSEEIRFLMGMLVLVMMGGLVAVIMPDKGNEMSVPVGFALCEPSRRVVASMFDLMLISFVLGFVFDARMIEVLSLSVIMRPDSSWLIYPSLMGIGVIQGTLSEWLFGASFGKWVTGLRVVQAKSGPMDRVSLGGALVRNLIKWFMPPVGFLMVVDPEGLHRGDRATQSIVVYPIDPTESDTDSGSSSEDE